MSVVADPLGRRLNSNVRWQHRWTIVVGRSGRSIALLTLAMLVSVACPSEQRVDASFHVKLPNPPTYLMASGPVVGLDEAHNNVALTAGRYAPFIEVLEADGFVVRSLRTAFTPALLNVMHWLVGHDAQK